jgi:hypothetical protein
LRKKTKKALRLSAHNAAMALQVLVEDGKIAARDVLNALKRREKMVTELKARLAALGEEAAPLTRRLEAAGRRAASRAPRRARKAISQAQRAARQAQGRYMSAVRTLSKQARARIKAIREKSGVDAAIRDAKRLAS